MVKGDNLKELLSGLGVLSDQLGDQEFLSTGSYALNKVISDSYFGGIPIGGITQFTGESSVGKTTFLTSIIREAQAKGYWCVYLDTEFALSKEFAKKVGLNPDDLIYPHPEEIETLEACFTTIEKYIKKIREVDKETPIIIGYDSLAVSPTIKELEAVDYTSDNMVGAHRAKLTGAAFRKLNPILRENKVALVVINQNRSKVGVMYGDPTVDAAGGKSLLYYLQVNMRIKSSKAGKLKDDNGKIHGIEGVAQNTKNKVGIPFRECKFALEFDKGLEPYNGLLEFFVEDGVITKSGGWYTIVSNGRKFQEKNFTELLLSDKDFYEVRTLLGMN